MQQAALIAAAVLLAVAFAGRTAAQDDSPDSAPPPLKVVSREESAKLATKTDLKDRTKLSLELMNLRLTAAEKFSAGHDFESMYSQLGYFHALMDEALDYLADRDNGGGKVLDNYKRLELALRAMGPRIEVIRRELPLRYDPYVRKLMGYLRSVRAKATDSLFGDSVVPTKRPGNPEL
jgi:hypothetical protein